MCCYDEGVISKENLCISKRTKPNIFSLWNEILLLFCAWIQPGNLFVFLRKEMAASRSIQLITTLSYGSPNRSKSNKGFSSRLLFKWGISESWSKIFELVWRLWDFQDCLQFLRLWEFFAWSVPASRRFWSDLLHSITRKDLVIN